MDVKTFSNVELITLYSNLLKELKHRGVIRTNNFIGEIGEYLAVDFYNKTKNLPTLQIAPPSTKNIDAISKDGERYSIKCTTTKTTGVFYGINSANSKTPQRQLFEHVIIVVLNQDLEISLILKLTWEQFLIYKHWHSRVNAWNLLITNKLINETKVIFKK